MDEDMPQLSTETKQLIEKEVRAFVEVSVATFPYVTFAYAFV
jgi:hypothetical protein